MGLTFFGLTYDIAPQTRAAIFTQIHEIVFHGKGGYDWHTIYDMPIWLRRFTFSKIQEFYSDEKSSYEGSPKNGSKTVIDSEGNVKSPELLQKAHANRTQSPPKRPAKYN